MKYLDCVELIVEKEEYAKQGVHKGMQGIIWLEESINGTWDVFFDLRGDHAPIGDIAIKEEDLKLIAKTDVEINERIKAQFDK
ncbi:MAG: hypothetical protein IJD45_04110 [Clostridia bacterium]|nr:hypothetical protein [Clostridia bacterium]